MNNLFHVRNGLLGLIVAQHALSAQLVKSLLCFVSVANKQFKHLVAQRVGRLEFGAFIHFHPLSRGST